MKKLLLTMGILVSLNGMSHWNGFKAEGNGVNKKETREVGSFSSVASSGSWDIMLAYGNSSSIQIEGNKYLLEYIETKVENGELNIRVRDNRPIMIFKKIVVYVSISEVKRLYLSGSGNIIGKGNFSHPGTTHVAVSGSGSIQLDFDRFNQIDVSVSGIGRIILKGRSNAVNAHITGSGSINCKEVVSNDVKALVRGSGDIHVQANVSLFADILGSGNIYYTGEAKKVRTGRGRIVKG